MNLLFIGDVVGRPGRRAVKTALPELVQAYEPDAIIANGENAAGGLGLTQDTALELLGLGITVMTTGNHVWQKKEFYTFLEDNTRILRPANYPPGAPGKGATVIHLSNGIRLGVVNLIGRVFMSPVDCPFRAADAIVTELSRECDLIVVDFHAEATSEKIAMGWFLDGRVACVVGTHTHVQTADERILPEGTGYISDLGMTGPVNSVLGVRTDIIIDRFLTGLPRQFQIASGPTQLCGAVVTVDHGTGKARAIQRVREAATE
ncbi:MAG: TIGR00282 family metallophosphoesterase [Firmicutes bacterium]|nr:TIGR00282 family metallophosphoesterase [Bacillota bacterium]